MASARASFRWASLAAAAAATWLGAASPTLAGPESLREGLFGRDRFDGRRFAAPPVARYVSEGAGSFVLDRTTPQPLLKFENSYEVWVLHPQPAPRGDVIYKNDLGEPVLRATRLGGVTIFTDARPGGAPAALAGGSDPIRLPTLSPEALLKRLAQASGRASRAARRLIPFEADADPGSAPLLADAAMVTAEAVVRVAAQPNGEVILARFTKVRLVEGGRPSATLRGGVMQITVAPADGHAGRPSSERIASAFGGR